MDKMHTHSGHSPESSISYLSNNKHYKPMPLCVFDEIDSSTLSDAEKWSLIQTYFKSDIYDHTIDYNKAKLADANQTSVRTLERRVGRLLDSNWLTQKGDHLQFNIPSDSLQRALKAPNRYQHESSEKQNRAYHKGPNGEKLFATYQNKDGTSTILWLGEGESVLSFDNLVPMLNNLLRHTLHNHQTLEVPGFEVSGLEATPLSKEELAVSKQTNLEAEMVSEFSINSELNHEASLALSELEGKLSQAENELALLSFVRNRTEFLEKNSEVASLKAEKQSLQSACGQLMEKPLSSCETATNLSQTSDKPVATPYINKPINKNTPSSDSASMKRTISSTDQLKRNCFLASPKKTNQPPKGYHHNQPCKLPKAIESDVLEAIDAMEGISSPEELKEGLLFAIARCFAGVPNNKPNSSEFEKLRFSKNVALKKLKEGTWRTPTGVKEQYHFTKDKKPQRRAGVHQTKSFVETIEQIAAHHYVQ